MLDGTVRGAEDADRRCPAAPVTPEGAGDFLLYQSGLPARQNIPVHRNAKRNRPLALLVVITMALTALTASLGSGSASASAPPVQLTVAYWSGYNPSGIDIMPAWLNAAAADFRKTHPNVTIKPEEITTSSEAEYYTKIDLSERNRATTPDIVFEDSFLIGSDASAGFLRPLPALTKWSGWSHYDPTMQKIVEYKGQVYGAMNSTDAELFFYSHKVLQKAGLPASWQPHSWSDVLRAAKAVKAHDPGVIPVWIYTGQASGEEASFRGFEVFLDGTQDRLYDYATAKWEISGPGLTSTWNLLAALRPYEEPESDWSSPLSDATVDLSLIPSQKVGIVLDGSWVATAFVPGGLKPWPGFFSAIGEAKLPTQNGQAPGYTNQSGGWALSVPAQAPHPDLSTAFIEAASSPQRLASFDPSSGNLPPRADVLTQPAWIKATKVNPVMNFAAAQIPYTNYRPGLPAYLEISNEIALLTGEISSGSITAQQAATQYATTVTGIVGSANVERRST